MKILVIAFFFIILFLAGFILGAVKNEQRPAKLRRKIKRNNRELDKLKREYSNFLSYDGSEQA